MAMPVKLHTEVSIQGDRFVINGTPTYEGRTWQGRRIEGLLLNSRMVQGVFDDLNPATRSKWNYPDTRKWVPDRNTNEFIAAMPEWRRHGLLAFTINLQGGCPQGYCREQPWHNSAIAADGTLRPDYMARVRRILDRADEVGLVVILGVFYFGQDERIRDEAAVVRALDDTVDWVLDHGYRNVLLEVNNECNVRYDHSVLKPERVHELIDRVRSRRRGGRRLLAGTSYGGGTIPDGSVVRASDFLLLHGNGVGEPARIAEMVRRTRALPGYRPMPILFNEDDHFDFEKPICNMTAAIGEHASWGYFDPGENNYLDGYQCPPVNWGINTPRKRAFFDKVAEITGGPGSFPGAEWEKRAPEDAGLSRQKLDALRDLVGGNGCVVRHGYLAYAWGDPAKSEDVASAFKPVLSTLLLMAIQEGRIRSADDPVAEFEPRLRELNAGKDAAITWRHLASQTSGYGLIEKPGAVWAYNDYALTLYHDTLMGSVFRERGTQALNERLAEPLGFQDACTFEAFGAARAGRLAISVRDFARFGLFWLHEGRWRGKRLLRPDLVSLALSSPVRPDTPRTSGREAAMLTGQRTIGGGKDITRTGPGFYSFNWWLNGTDRLGRRLFADAPPDTFAASGHGGKRMLWIVPSLDLVVAWNDTKVDDQDSSPENPQTRANRAARVIRESVLR